MTKDVSNRSQLIHDIHDYCINPETREIYLHGYLGESEEEAGVDYRMAVRFEKNLMFLDKSADDPITIHMHTIGGAWHDGIGIFDTIKSSRCEITIIGYAEVSSMSSIIFQAADKRLLMPNTSFMIHYGEIAIDSNSVSAKSAIDENERTNRLMVGIYTERCKGGEKFENHTEARIKKFLDTKMRQKQEWYLSAKEAVDYGFADGVYE